MFGKSRFSSGIASSFRMPEPRKKLYGSLDRGALRTASAFRTDRVMVVLVISAGPAGERRPDRVPSGIAPDRTEGRRRVNGRGRKEAGQGPGQGAGERGTDRRARWASRRSATRRRVSRSAGGRLPARQDRALEFLLDELLHVGGAIGIDERLDPGLVLVLGA